MRVSPVKRVGGVSLPPNAPRRASIHFSARDGMRCGMALPSKQALKDELVGLLQADLDSLERAYEASREGATHEEAKPENDKDTRALEQSYLARGQARRVEDLRSNVVDVKNMPVRDFGAEEPVALSAVVRVEQNDEPRMLFLAPQGGGAALHGGAIQVVTPRSPMGRALMGKLPGDDMEVQVAGRVLDVLVMEVR